MTVRRYVLQNRGWEDAQGHRAEAQVGSTTGDAHVLPFSDGDTK